MSDMFSEQMRSEASSPKNESLFEIYVIYKSHVIPKAFDVFPSMEQNAENATALKWHEDE